MDSTPLPSSSLPSSLQEGEEALPSSSHSPSGADATSIPDAEILEAPQENENEIQATESPPAAPPPPEIHPVMEADFSSCTQVCVCEEFQNGNISGGNFLKGVKWSPDGSCFLTCSEDNILRVFETPHQQQVNITEQNSTHNVYDYGWYPQMTGDEATACFVSTSRDHPVQLWDAFTGKLRCTYRKYNQMDEIHNAYGVCFGASGEKIFCGYNGEIGYFYTNLPGREYKKLMKFDRKSLSGIPGIISCFAVSSACPSCIACYAAVFDESTGEQFAHFTDPTKKMNGVTQVTYSRDGWSLFVGCRKSNEILCWDLRYVVEEPYLRLGRQGDTNQKIGFDIDWSGRYLLSGNKDGAIIVYDLHNNGQALSPSPFPSQSDAVNGIALNPRTPLLAMSTGQRTFTFDGDASDDSDDEEGPTTGTQVASMKQQNIVSIWQLHATWIYPTPPVANVPIENMDSST